MELFLQELSVFFFFFLSHTAISLVAEISILVNNLPEYSLQVNPKGRILCIAPLLAPEQAEVSWTPEKGHLKQHK